LAGSRAWNSSVQPFNYLPRPDALIFIDNVGELSQAGGESFNSALQFRLIYVLGVAAVRATSLEANSREFHS